MEAQRLLIVSVHGYAILVDTDDFRLQGRGGRGCIDDFRLQGRGGRGCIGLKKTARNGDVADTAVIIPGKHIACIVTTKAGMVIKFPLVQVKETGRNTAGVKVIELALDDEVSTITAI
jgi:DNA gyrase subunit A